MPKQIIGLTGRIGAGKSLAAQELERLGYTRTRFAGALKDMMRALGLTEDHIEGHLKELPCDLLGGKTPRYAMQTIGTEWGRDIISPLLWINAWKRRVQSLPAGIPATVEDVRFPNEAMAVRSVGGLIVRIDRPSANGKIVHPSELMDFPPDIVIRNDGTIEAFLERVRALTNLKYSAEGEPTIAA